LSDEAKTERQVLKDALRPFADAYWSMERSGADMGFVGLMYDPKDPKMTGLGACDLKPLYDIFERMVAEDGGSRL